MRRRDGPWPLLTPVEEGGRTTDLTWGDAQRGTGAGGGTEEGLEIEENSGSKPRQVFGFLASSRASLSSFGLSRN